MSRARAAGANCLNSTCPGFKCKESVGEEVFEMLLEPDQFAKYRAFLLNSFVDDNPEVAWFVVLSLRLGLCWADH